MLKIILACALTAAESYLLGSIVFGIIISKLIYHDDVRTHGSGSAGMTNMLRNYGKFAAFLTTLGDLGKGMVAVLLGEWLFATVAPGAVLDPICGAYLAAIFSMTGHVKPLYFGFKGGKGVLISAGAAIVTEPLVALILFLIFMTEVLITRIVSLGSIIIAVLYPIATLSYWVWHGVNLPSAVFIGVCTVAMCLMVLYMHRTNIQRLRDGTEYRFGDKKKPGVK